MSVLRNMRFSGAAFKASVAKQGIHIIGYRPFRD